jgi:hypothetical protein
MLLEGNGSEVTVAHHVLKSKNNIHSCDLPFVNYKTDIIRTCRHLIEP